MKWGVSHLPIIVRAHASTNEDIVLAIVLTLEYVPWCEGSFLHAMRASTSKKTAISN
jgi:hypothetical protein